ncbi:NUDIX pyrophosphatase [Iodobacter sp.]|uniref:NUDIX hydrolase n=1 Tax=Iodobacter sp. TaxID=1915058 RepID=UPI0025D7DB6F|nr:NUDIX domain-containing protein [Iodobacter sp.]
MRLPFSIQVFLVSNNMNGRKYLLLQRNARPELALPDFWQGISGALEAGEPHEQAAIREIFEETGIVASAVMSSGYKQTYPIKPEWRAQYGLEPTVVQERVFYCDVSEHVNLRLSPEHKAYQWLPYENAKALLTFGQNAACLESVEFCIKNAIETASPAVNTGVK